MGPGGIISVPVASGRCVALLGPQLLRGRSRPRVRGRSHAPDRCLSSEQEPCHSPRLLEDDRKRSVELHACRALLQAHEPTGIGTTSLGVDTGGLRGEVRGMTSTLLSKWETSPWEARWLHSTVLCLAHLHIRHARHAGGAGPRWALLLEA